MSSANLYSGSSYNLHRSLTSNEEIFVSHVSSLFTDILIDQRELGVPYFRANDAQDKADLIFELLGELTTKRNGIYLTDITDEQKDQIGAALHQQNAGNLIPTVVSSVPTDRQKISQLDFQALNTANIPDSNQPDFSLSILSTDIIRYADLLKSPNGILKFVIKNQKKKISNAYSILDDPRDEGDMNVELGLYRRPLSNGDTNWPNYLKTLEGMGLALPISGSKRLFLMLPIIDFHSLKPVNNSTVGELKVVKNPPDINDPSKTMNPLLTPEFMAKFPAILAAAGIELDEYCPLWPINEFVTCIVKQGRKVETTELGVAMQYLDNGTAQFGAWPLKRDGVYRVTTEGKHRTVYQKGLESMLSVESAIGPRKITV